MRLIFCMPSRVAGLVRQVEPLGDHAVEAAAHGATATACAVATSVVAGESRIEPRRSGSWRARTPRARARRSASGRSASDLPASSTSRSNTMNRPGARPPACADAALRRMDALQQLVERRAAPSTGMTISPSSTNCFALHARAAPSTSPGSSARAACPPWTAARPSSPSRNARQRKPSHFGSYCQPAARRELVDEPRLHRRVVRGRSGRRHSTRLQLEAPALREERLPEIADLREARGHVVDAEVLDADAALDFLPRDRRRHGRAAACGRDGVDATPACGPRRSGCSRRARGRSGRLAMRYSAVISSGCAARERLRERLGERPHLLLRRAAHDRHVDVDALGAGRLRVARHAERRRAPSRTTQRRLAAPARRSAARHGIEVEVQVVGPVDVVAARVPLVQVDAAEVDDPEQRRAGPGSSGSR